MQAKNRYTQLYVMSKEELKLKILANIQKSGFVSEMKVNSMLIKKGWAFTLSGETFTDKDLNKSREIDLMSFKQISNEDNSLTISVQLIIEVKKSEKPWIIFCQKRQNFFHTIFGINILRDSENISMSELSFNDLNENNKHFNSTYFGTAFTEAFKDTSETSQVYSALITACKAAVHFKKDESKQSKPYVKIRDKNEKRTLHIYLPVVVLNGNLYRAILDDLGEVDLEEVNYCPVNLNYTSENYSQSRFSPEIVTLNEFNNYLDYIDRWQLEIFEKVLKKIE